MLTTRQWAESHGIDVQDSLPAEKDYREPLPRTAQEVAQRSIILHSVAAVGYGVDPEPIVHWLIDQAIWQDVSPKEQQLLKSSTPAKGELGAARWRQEAQWALLWAINEIESLGLPTQTCDTGRLVDHVMPALGASISRFVTSAQLRSPGEVLVENDRVYNLHCHARSAMRQNRLPGDLVYPVLFQRHYAFEWLSGHDDWDDVPTDT